MRVDWDNPVDMDHPLNRGLVAWWMAGEGPYWGGPLFRDLVPKSSRGGGNHGTLTNGTEWKGALGFPGQFGSLVFDGTNDTIDCGEVTGAGQNELTVAVVFRKSSASRGGLIGRWNDSGNNDVYRLYLSGGGSPFNLIFALKNSSNVSDAVTFTSSILNDTNYTLVGTWRDGDNLRIYRGGILGATSAATFAGPLKTPTGAKLWLMSPIEFQSGNLFAAVVWHRQLSAADVASWNSEVLAGYPQTLNRVRPYSILDTGGAAPATAFPWHYYQQMQAMAS